MDLKNVAKRFGLLVLLASAAAPLAAAPATAERPAAAPRGCDALRQWVVEHRAELPTSYFELRAYPANEHRAIYSLLEPELKAAYWHDKLAAYLAEHPELHPKQVAAFGEAASLIRPDIYRSTDPESDEKRAVDRELAAAATKLVAAVGEKVASEAFFGLGLDRPGSPGGLGRNVVQEGVIPPSEICACNSYFDCGGPYLCGLLPNENCVWVIGCGFFGASYCTGLCIYF